METEVQTAVTFEESSVRKFLQGCNEGNLDDAIAYLHPAVHYQSYTGGLPDMGIEGIENLRFYLEGRSIAQDYQCHVRHIECGGKEMRVAYESSATSETHDKLIRSGTQIYIFSQQKIIQILDTA